MFVSFPVSLKNMFTSIQYIIIWLGILTGSLTKPLAWSRILNQKESSPEKCEEIGTVTESIHLLTTNGNRRKYKKVC